MLVREVMNTNVKKMSQETTVQEAAKFMTDNNIGSLIIVDEKENMVGIVTEGDMLKKVVAEAKNSSETTLKLIMTKKVMMIGPDQDVSEAVDIMSEYKIKKLPVLEKNSVIGILTATDVCMIQPKLAEKLAEIVSIPKEQKTVAG